MMKPACNAFWSYPYMETCVTIVQDMYNYARNKTYMCCSFTILRSAYSYINTYYYRDILNSI